MPKYDTETSAFICIASCEYAIVSKKFRNDVVEYKPKVVPIIGVGQKYQPPSDIVSSLTQIGFNLIFELLPIVTMYVKILSEQQLSLSIKTIDLIEVGDDKVTFQNSSEPALAGCCKLDMPISNINPSHAATAVGAQPEKKEVCSASTPELKRLSMLGELRQ